MRIALVQMEGIGMKRHFLVTIVFFLLIGVSVSPLLMREDFFRAGIVKRYHNIHGRNHGIESGGLHVTEKIVRNGLHLDQDDFGGSWYDDFRDASGVENKENVNLEAGDVLLNVVDNNSKSSRTPNGFAYSKAGSLSASNCQSSDDNSVYGGNEDHYVDLDSSGNQYVEFFFPTFGLTSSPILGDVEFEYSIESGKSFSNPYSADYDAQTGSWNNIGVPPNADRIEHHVTNSLHKVSYDTVNEANGMRVRFGYDPASDSGKLFFDFVQLSFITSYFTSGSLTSTVIELPQGKNWSVISIHKEAPPNTHVKVSVINASSNLIIPGFNNLTDTNIEISNIPTNRIRLKAWFQGNGLAIPRLGSWGVEWTADNAWRDGFTGNARTRNSTNLNFSDKVDLIDADQVGELKSDVIELPLNRSWSTLHFDRTVPGNTYLNISVYDGITDELLLREWNRTKTGELDMSHIAASEHPEIYLYGEFMPKQAQSPALHSWAVNWSIKIDEDEENHTIELIENVPDILYVTEDTPRNGIIDFLDYFSVPYSDIHPPTYMIEPISDDDNITLKINNSKLDVIYLADNWTGTCEVIINCTSTYDLKGSSTNPFNISVIAVDDAPAWKNQPPSLSVKQGKSSVGQYSLNDHVTDAENDEFGFNINISGSGLTVELNENNHINVTHTGDFSGNAIITVKVYQISNDSLFSSVSIPLQVSMNIPPMVTLISPQNGTIISVTEIVLMWEIGDPDTIPEKIRSTLYFGEGENPDIYESGMEKNYMSVGNLEDGVTYYWSVIPLDEIEEGSCSNGPWSFTVDRSKPVPEISYLSPLNGDIINIIDINLTWQVHNGSDDKLQFEIYFGDSRDILSKIGTTEKKLFPLESLRENITYYWKVVPIVDGILGTSKSGVWSFTILKNFTAIYNISGSVDRDLITVGEGTTAFSINLTINNTGNKVNYIRIYAGGDLFDVVLISPSQISLFSGDYDIIKVTVLVTNLEPGLYHFFLTLAHEGPIDELINISVNITKRISNGSTEDPNGGKEEPEGNGEKNEKEGTKSLFYPILFTIIIGSVFLMVIFVIIYKRRKKMDNDRIADLNMEIDSLKTDIVHIPSRGVVKASEMPHLKDNEEKSKMGPVKVKDEKVKKTDKSKYNIRKKKDTKKVNAVSTQGVSGKKDIDLSGIFIPKDHSLDQTKGKLDDAVLALPPARFIHIDEEDRKVPIEELFLMTPTGILLQYYSLERETAINEDILASMLSAVTSFILDSLTMVGKEDVDEGDLCIEMGEFSVILATGETLNLVAITSRAKKEEVKIQLEKGVDVLEEKFGEIMMNWDGDMGKIEGVKLYVVSLVKGEFDKLIRKKQLDSRQVPNSIPLTEGIDTTKSKIGLLGQAKDDTIKITEELRDNEKEASLEKTLFDMPMGGSPIEKIISERIEIIEEKNEPPPPLDEPDSDEDKPTEESTLDDLDIEIW